MENPTPILRKGSAPAQTFTKQWWDGLGLSFAGDGEWGPEPKAMLHVNGQKLKYRRAVADGDAPMDWIENEWARWYPALNHARSRVEFHALWLCIRWSVGEAHRLGAAA